MGFPVNSFQHILDDWDNLKGRYPYFLFFLFTEEHSDFQRLFMDNLLRWDEMTGESNMFFALSPFPKDGLDAAEGRNYWERYMIDGESNRAFDKTAIHQVARYFSVPQEQLPSIVLFHDIKRRDSISIRLAGLDMEQANNLISNIFRLLNNNKVQRYHELWRVQRLIDLLPVNRQLPQNQIDEYVSATWQGKQFRRVRQIRGIELGKNERAYHVNSPNTIHETLDRLVHEMDRLRQEVHDLRSEQREGFERIDSRLEKIEVILRDSVTRIKDFRQSFLVNLMNAGDDEGENGLIDLHATFDQTLRNENQVLVERISEAFESAFPSELNNLETYFEPESIAILRSSEILWNYLQTHTPPYDVDYAVCGIGLWTAMEVELNRAFVDALRVWNRICSNGSPSTKQSVQQMARTTEASSFRNPVKINPYETQGNPTKLKGLTLGSIYGLLRVSDRNSFQNIFPNLNFPIGSNDPDNFAFAEKLSHEVQMVTNTYRNAYAHIQKMEKSIYEDFRSYMLDDSKPHNPLFSTVRCKIELENNRFI